MSFILDALKKSESERRQQGEPAYAQVPVHGDERRPPVWTWLLAILLLVNLAVLAGLYMRPAETDPVPTAVGPPPEPAATVPEAAARSFEDRVRQAVAEKPPLTRQTEKRAAEPAPAPLTAESAAPAVEPLVTTAPDLNALPTASELVTSGELPLTDLRLDIHVYSERPADRFVFINMIKHREGSVTADGMEVSEITPDGVVLNWRGREFVLPRN